MTVKRSGGRPRTNKIKVSFTISKEALEFMNKFCEENNLTKTDFFTNLILDKKNAEKTQ